MREQEGRRCFSGRRDKAKAHLETYKKARDYGIIRRMPFEQQKPHEELAQKPESTEKVDGADPAKSAEKLIQNAEKETTRMRDAVTHTRERQQNSTLPQEGDVEAQKLHLERKAAAQEQYRLLTQSFQNRFKGIEGSIKENRRVIASQHFWERWGGNEKSMIAQEESYRSQLQKIQGKFEKLWAQAKTVEEKEIVLQMIAGTDSSGRQTGELFKASPDFKTLRAEYESTEKKLEYAEKALQVSELALNVAASYAGPPGVAAALLPKYMVRIGVSLGSSGAQKENISTIAMDFVQDVAFSFIGGGKLTKGALQKFGPLGTRIVKAFTRVPGEGWSKTALKTMILEVAESFRDAELQGLFAQGREAITGEEVNEGTLLERATGNLVGRQAGKLVGKGLEKAGLADKIKMIANGKNLRDLRGTEELQNVQKEIMSIPDTPEGLVQRIAAAETVIKRPLMDMESTAIARAHDVPMTGVDAQGNPTYSTADLRKKMDILEQSGFVRDEADLLLRMGVCGRIVLDSGPSIIDDNDITLYSSPSAAPVAERSAWSRPESPWKQPTETDQKLPKRPTRRSKQPDEPRRAPRQDVEADSPMRRTLQTIDDNLQHGQPVFVNRTRSSGQVETGYQVIAKLDNDQYRITRTIEGGLTQIVTVDGARLRLAETDRTLPIRRTQKPDESRNTPRKNDVETDSPMMRTLRTIDEKIRRGESVPVSITQPDGSPITGWKAVEKAGDKYRIVPAGQEEGDNWRWVKAERLRLSDANQEPPTRRPKQPDEQNHASRQAEKIKSTPKIVDGVAARSLNEARESFNTPTGEKINAATDAGIGYKNGNEDRVAVNPEESFTAVIDGMGGYGDGDKAAQALAESLTRNPKDVMKAVQEAQRNMKGLAPNAGAVFISARVVSDSMGRKALEIHQAGDARLMIAGRDGRVKFVSKDDSFVQVMQDAGGLGSDEALFHPKRNIVSNSIQTNSGSVKKQPLIPVQSGDRVYLMSDGISDNLTPDEIVALGNPGTTNASEAIRTISDVTGKRMQNADALKKETDDGSRKRNGKYTDGFKSEAKPDNRAISIIDIH